jgi:hypothetical protein
MAANLKGTCRLSTTSHSFAEPYGNTGPILDSGSNLDSKAEVDKLLAE